MKKGGCFLRSFVLVLLISVFTSLPSTSGIRFLLDRRECLSHSIPYENDKILVSFVVVKADVPWHYGDAGVDLVVKGPKGEQIHDSRGKTDGKFDFISQSKGVHRFCFTNRSPYHETIDFDVHVSHFTHHDPHAKDEHLKPLFEQIATLEGALHNVLFEQHWMEAQRGRQVLVNETMSKRAAHKALFESAALVLACALQVYLLRRLFDNRLAASRVYV